MKRFLALVALLSIAVLSLGASSITFVYGSNISSIDMDEDVGNGQIFTDESGNVLAVKSVLRDVPYGAKEPGDVVLFDKIISKGPYEVGSTLTRRGPLHSIGAFVGMYHFLAGYSFSCGLYPVYPVVMGGVGYDLGSVFSGGSFSFTGALVMAGIGVTFPIARLWDSSNTFIQNGKLASWCAAGVSIGSSVTFASTYGFAYRHSLGTFHWDLGVSWMYRTGTSNLASPYLGAGVYI